MAGVFTAASADQGAAHRYRGAPVPGLERHPHPQAARHRAAARTAAGATTSSGAAAMTANPAPRMARLTSTPGLGSAARAGPMGISGDAAIATTTAAAAPAVVMIAPLASDS